MDKKPTILIVDDELLFREILSDALGEKYTVLTRNDGTDIISFIEREKPDLIMLDIEMPGKNGIEICKEIKGNFATRTTPVLMLTSRSGKDQIVEGLSAGADDYLSKPIHPPEILAKVDSHLRAKGHYSELEPKDLVMLLELSEAISASRNPSRILQYIVDKIVDVVDVARCSIVSINSNNDMVVKASSDLPSGEEIQIDIKKYPEIKLALDTKKPVIVNNIKTAPLMDSVREYLSSLDFNSIVVVPIVKKESVIGTFFLRTASPLVNCIDERVSSLCQLMANISANALENAVLFESMKKAHYDLEQMAITDGLTNLYNHRHFYNRLEENFSRAQRYDLDLSCLFIDVDDFKKVNDRFGHRCGDEVLRKVGIHITKVVRDSDVAARYGGEEFVILLVETGIEGASITAKRLQDLIRNDTHDCLNGEKITVSIGVTAYRKGNFKTADEFLQVADNAMYSAKHLGKNQISITED